MVYDRISNNSYTLNAIKGKGERTMVPLKVAVLVPTEREIRPFIEGKNSWVLQVHGKMIGWQFMRKVSLFYDVEVTCITTGVGKTNAAFTTGVVCKMGMVDFIIHAGVAGTYSENEAKIGDVVVVTESILGDEGVMYDDGQVGTYEAMGIPVYRDDNMTAYDRLACSHQLLDDIRTLLPSGRYSISCKSGDLYKCYGDPREEVFHIHYGSTLSVSLASGGKGVATSRRSFWGAMIEDMESSAVMLSALRLGVPVVVIRGVSNIAGVRDRRYWGIENAMKNAKAVVFHCIDNIGQWYEKSRKRE